METKNEEVKKSIHRSVLLKEILSGLNVPKGGVYFDGTINAGGHALAIAESLKGDVTVIGFDQDNEALINAKRNLENKVKTLILKNNNFRNCEKIFKDLGLSGKVTSVLFDLGFSSDQLENSGRGFSFRRDEPLLMNLSNGESKSKFTAYEIVNTWDEENLVAIFKGYGEEKYSKKIARAIVKGREKKPIETTKELSKLIVESYPVRERFKRIHPATKIFQALRITVNDELEALKEGLKSVWEVTGKNGRIAIISFHSLEDRIVKRFFQEKAKAGLGILLNKKPIIADDKEVEGNPRSRSAKLRIIEKI
ncbi:MAG: 16S rRNA (cytosine(1402)-N(4))-methyltransferase RsmH [Patescibacteria group bacterium]